MRLVQKGKKISEFTEGSQIPSKEFSCDKVQLFLYNAVLFNAHLIHYDHTYATEVEGYADLVLAGPLIGDWLHQCVDGWLGEECQLLQMEYSNRHAAYVDEVLIGGGTITKIDVAHNTMDLELHIKNADGDVIAPGKAKVSFAPA